MTDSNNNSAASAFPVKPSITNVAVQLRQGAWHLDADFLALLEQSWRSQYTDYIGERCAGELIDRLREEGRLYEHHKPSTLHAWIGDKIVGITSTRPLAGIDLITMLEVIPSYRGLGIGTRMMEALCSNSARLMAHVSIHKPRAKGFYTRNGFHVLQRTHVLHGEHNLEFDVLAKSTG